MSRTFCRPLLAGCLATLLALPVAAQSSGAAAAQTKDPAAATDDIALPGFPEEKNLVPFYVSATTAHRFMIDATSLEVGGDGVVRYTLVVKTGGGATNTSFEGMRCATGEYRIYASGQPPGRWSAARLSAWRTIENKPTNRYHAALFHDLFCPGGVAIGSAGEGRAALRPGNPPQAMR